MSAAPASSGISSIWSNVSSASAAKKPGLGGVDPLASGTTSGLLVGVVNRGTAKQSKKHRSRRKSCQLSMNSSKFGFIETSIKKII